MPGALLCVEFYGDAPEDLLPRLDALEAELPRLGFRCRWRRALTAGDQARIWSLREAALGLSMAMKGDAKSLSFVEDTAVAPEKLRDYIERFLQIVKRHGTSAGVYAHASVGCLHVRPVVNLKTADGVRRFEAIANDIADLVLEFGGALSGEHGDGLVRGAFTEKMFGPVLYEAFRAVKRAFDPAGLFNPGKIVDTPPMTANLRYGAGYTTPDPATFFDYAEHGGMSRAVEMCSGLGVCRKTLEGTMCPSYMATREENHSTRGRANVLRLAMAGRLGESGLGDEGVREVLDLCLECRACKAECPVGVDVARFKSEFLADYYRRHGTPLRARAIGHIHTMSKWASRAAPLANAAVGSKAGRWLGEQLFGIDRRRTLPAWTGDTFARRFARRAAHLPIPNLESRIPNPESRVPPSSSSTTPSRTTRIPKSASPLPMFSRRQGPRSGSHRTSAAAGRSFRRDCSTRHERLRRRTPTPCTTRRPVVNAFCFSSRAVSRRFAKTRPRCSAATSSAERASSPTRVRCSRIISSANVRPDRSRCRCARVRQPCCFTATAIRKPWASCRRRARCSGGSRRAPWSISTRAAAGWRGRSATRASTTTCRVRLESVVCCPPRGPWRPTRF